ncbi:MAG: hypothetical protein PHP65_03715 [Bacilli bacterium]|jgi:hypothetical protein|nr:hypothetical protein [Bacilli bacterium]
MLEAAMVVCFGVSWPLSIYKSYKARTTKGKSIIFLCFILLGYALGIANKIVHEDINYVIFFYIINFIMVFMDILLFFRNKRLDNELARG